MDDVWGIVLAAGASTRMKTQKMLLPFKGKSVIETVIENVTESLKKNIVVVLGSGSKEIIPLIENMQVNYCINENYRLGMLTSVISGFNALPQAAKAALIILGDQPQLKGRIIDEVINTWHYSEKGIVIPVFNGKRGHPVLIETRFRELISQLDPDQGLRSLVFSCSKEVQEVECGSSGILRDMDTPEDYFREINLIN